MRRAPPTVPGTPMSPSIPPRLFFAQKVIMRPRSAAASTCAKLPSSTTSGSGRTSCRTTWQLPITDEQVRASTEELMRNVVRIEKFQEIGKAFVIFDAEQVRRPADAQRSKAGKG